MNEQEIFEKKRPGDYVLVAQMLGLSRKNVQRITERPRAKRRKAVMEALEKIIKAREDLLTQGNKQEA